MLFHAFKFIKSKMPTLLNVENVVKYFGSHAALSDISFSVPQGIIFGILGPNGAGKTTLLRILNQILTPEYGKIYFNDERLNASHLKYIGYLPEERGLYKRMKVGEQALYLARLKGIEKNIALERLKYWFEKLEIQSWWDKRLLELSKGMQQKVQFIISLLHEPKLLILDEPFSGFDPINAGLIKKQIIELKNKGTTILLSTHNMASVEKLCDNILIINQSKKILEGSIEEIQNQFRSNTFEIIFQDDFFEHTLKGNEHFKLLSVHQNGNNRSKIKIKVTGKITSNELLKQATLAGKIISFNEIIPGMDEIFIQSIQNKQLKLNPLTSNDEQ